MLALRLKRVGAASPRNQFRVLDARKSVKNRSHISARNADRPIEKQLRNLEIAQACGVAKTLRLQRFSRGTQCRFLNVLRRYFADSVWRMANLNELAIAKKRPSLLFCDIFAAGSSL